MLETGIKIIMQNYANIRARAYALQNLNAAATDHEIDAFVEGAKWAIRNYHPAVDEALLAICKALATDAVDRRDLDHARAMLDAVWNEKGNSNA